mmetsp:Transcript_33249/g.93223  ORF Transcript_33249/g.93223 Transcript_33249/m.93223 type:complete len:477 (+) Transcript_33249:97-1527(+)
MPANRVDHVRLKILSNLRLAEEHKLEQRSKPPSQEELHSKGHTMSYLFQNESNDRGWRMDPYYDSWDCRTHWTYPLSQRLRRKIDRCPIKGQELELQRWATQLNVKSDEMKSPDTLSTRTVTLVEYFVKPVPHPGKTTLRLKHKQQASVANEEGKKGEGKGGEKTGTGVESPLRILAAGAGKPAPSALVASVRTSDDRSITVNVEHVGPSVEPKKDGLSALARSCVTAEKTGKIFSRGNWTTPKRRSQKSNAQRKRKQYLTVSKKIVGMMEELTETLREWAEEIERMDDNQKYTFWVVCCLNPHFPIELDQAVGRKLDVVIDALLEATEIDYFQTFLAIFVLYSAAVSCVSNKNFYNAETPSHEASKGEPSVDPKDTASEKRPPEPEKDLVPTPSQGKNVEKSRTQASGTTKVAHHNLDKVIDAACESHTPPEDSGVASNAASQRVSPTKRPIGEVENKTTNDTVDNRQRKRARKE